MVPPEKERAFARDLVLRCLRSELPAGATLPNDTADWAENGLDSMACVAVQSCIARAINSPGLFDSVTRTRGLTIQAAVEAIERVLLSRSNIEESTKKVRRDEKGAAAIPGWGVALGSDIVSSAAVEREFGLATGTLSERAGIETVSRATRTEDELSLAVSAGHQALRRADVSVQNLNCIIGTSETFLAFPSFAASVHTNLLAPISCRSLDVGGGCAGLANSLAIADALIQAGQADLILIVSADVHSRLLLPNKVRGEFAGLFGDGACAFLLCRSDVEANGAPFAVLATTGGCTGAYFSALQVRPLAGGSLSLTFEGEALALAAVHQMEQIINDLEISSGRSRHAACAFALHQPNPRLLEVLVRQANLAPAKVPLVAKTRGNLGSSTCGVALGMALEEHSAKPRAERGPIFVAAVAPGMLWSGLVLE
jgi:3-oxoacyl-[acyl-carrier-protein] synthase III